MTGARILFLASTCLLVACCPEPSGDVLVVNNTESPVVFALANGSARTEAMAGRLGMLSGPPGAQIVIVTNTDGVELGRTELQTAIEHVKIALALPSECLAFVDYTRQYRDETGPIDILALVLPASRPVPAHHYPSSITHGQLSHLYGPYDELPAETYPNAIIRRATTVSCELLEHDELLVNTLARLP